MQETISSILVREDKGGIVPSLLRQPGLERSRVKLSPPREASIRNHDTGDKATTLFWIPHHRGKHKLPTLKGASKARAFRLTVHLGHHDISLCYHVCSPKCNEGSGLSWFYCRDDPTPQNCWANSGRVASLSKWSLWSWGLWDWYTTTKLSRNRITVCSKTCI